MYNPEEKAQYLENPQKVTKKGKKAASHVKKNTEPLFPHPPRIEDIQQSFDGECFLLSAIASILSRPNGPQIIQNMIKEVPPSKPGDQPMIELRLFDKEGNPKRYRMTKDVRKNPFRHAGGPLWVSLLEKAYVAIAMDGDYNQLKGGGESGKALAILLGEPPTRKKVSNYDSKDLYILASAFDSDPKHKVTNLDFLKNDFRLSDNEITIWQAVRNRFELSKKWNEIVKKQKWTVDPYTKNIHEATGNDHLHIFRHEDFISLFDPQDMTTQELAVVRKIASYEREHIVFPGKRGTKRYTSEQNSLYAHIKEQTEGGFSINASTHNYVSPRLWGSLFSKGLGGSHAYTVLGCEERNGVKYIKIRNPWQLYGRGYVEKTDKHGQKVLSATAIKANTFELELTDFCKRIESVDVVGCYLTYIKSPLTENMIPNKVPAYILATNGLYYCAKKEQVTADNLITNDPHKIQELREKLAYQKEGTSLLSPTQREIISSISSTSLAEEKALTEGGIFIYTRASTDIKNMQFDKIPSYLLTPDGLYKITRRNVYLDESNADSKALVNSRVSINWLWLKLSKDYSPTNPNDNNRFLQPKENDSLLNWIAQSIGKGRYGFDKKAVYHDIANLPLTYMEEYNLNDRLCTGFINALIEFLKTDGFERSNLDALFEEISPVQMQGLLNLNIKFGKQPDAPEGTCLELVEKLSPQTKAKLHALFPSTVFTKESRHNPAAVSNRTIIETNPGLALSFLNINKYSYKADNVAEKYQPLKDYLQRYDLSSDLVELYVRGVQTAIEADSMIGLNFLRTQLSEIQKLGLKNLSFQTSEPGSRPLKFGEIINRIAEEQHVSHAAQLSEFCTTASGITSPPLSVSINLPTTTPVRIHR